MLSSGRLNFLASCGAAIILFLVKIGSWLVAVGAAGGEKSGTNFHPRFPHSCNIAKVKPVPNLPLTLDELLE